MTIKRTGRSIRTDGYVSLWAPDHPHVDCNGRVLEHIYVVEKILGHRLPPRAEVHHINEDKQDNRPENLVVCENQAYHKLLHKRTVARDVCGNPNWRRCRYCGEHDDPANMRQGSPSGGIEHRACKLRHRRGKWAATHPGAVQYGEYPLARVRGSQYRRGGR